MPSGQPSRLKRVALGLLALAVATAIWLPTVRFVFAEPVERFHQAAGVPVKARQLAARHLAMWSNPALRQHELDRMRSTNAEWDFMGRTYLVLALGNLALRDPASQKQCLEVMDAIIDDTLTVEADKGMYHFLMGYARGQPFVQQPARSVFVDGEIALMAAARRMVRDEARYADIHRQRVALMLERMEQSPTLCAESYPDECWIFCNTVALAAIRLHDHLDKADHSEFFQRWLTVAKRTLIDPATGMLISSFSLKGQVNDGPEGSSIWMAAHCLQLIDPDFARDQYQRARNLIGRTMLGFGYAREWPNSWTGPQDVDSGPIVPIVGASSGASGLALVGAAAFDDQPFLQALHTSLNFAAFPIRDGGALRYGASNQVGDAVLLYSCLEGPMWERVRQGRQR